jgi:excisionase family DNA binding protein
MSGGGPHSPMRRFGDENLNVRPTAVRRTAVMMERRTVSVRQACELVSVTRQTIYNWIYGNKLDYVHTASGSIRIYADSLWRDAQHQRLLIP